MNQPHPFQVRRGRSLLRAICADPRDNDVRLIFADWLLENGYDPWAELIQFQFWKHERLRQPIGLRESKRLHARERELLTRSEHLTDWPLSALMPDSDIFWGDVENGFLWVVRTGGIPLVQNAAHLFAVLPIVFVRLRLWEGDVGSGVYTGEEAFEDDRLLHDAGMTTHGTRRSRVPGPIFAFLDKVGMDVTVRRATARLGDEVNGTELVSRACVAYGRHQARLPPLRWDRKAEAR
jgi:uncharacterized protein (TIGR02996 family)